MCVCVCVCVCLSVCLCVDDADVCDASLCSGTDEDLQRRLSQLKQELSRLDQEEKERERIERAGLAQVGRDLVGHLQGDRTN